MATSLTPPDPAYAAAFGRLVADYRRAGEQSRVTKYEGGEADFPAYVESLRLAARGINLPEGRVPYHTYWLVDGGEIVGVARVRPRPTAGVERADGHIGYDVPPSHRGKGYATALLRLMVAKARRHGLSRVFVNCAADNVASQGVIERCGGRRVGEVAALGSGERRYRYEFRTAPVPTGRPSTDA